jgi:diguanylate cyclase (GGDEF)-like protein/PAS domain S-box-containing protein
VLQIEWHDDLLRDESGRLLGVLSIGCDISARLACERSLDGHRRHLEAQVAERTADLRASEEQFRMLFENSAVSMMVHDRNTCEVIDANRRALEAYGVTDISGLRQQDIWADPPYSFADVQRWFAKVREEGPQRFEWMSRNIRGEEFWEEVVLQEITLRGMRRIVSTSADITERKNVEAKMMRMAHYDALTDLPNRLLFFDRAQQALNLAKRTESRMALMLLDLDHFKPVNDDFGHAVGDLLLQEAAQRMKACLRASDTVGRIGGDEFVVLLPVIEHEQDAVQVAEKIREELGRPFHLAGQVLRISCSVGIALYPEHGTSVIELSKCADLAMYRVKKQGRNACRLFQEEMLEPDTESEPPH